MKKLIRRFEVVPNLPLNLKPLIELASNLWWVWEHDATELMIRIDREIWDECYHNPIKVLARTSQNRLNELADDESFINHMERVYEKFKNYIESTSWFETNYSEHKNEKIAYFSAEYGIHETVPIYSGGLGMLAGDHIKSASDLGIPLVGVGLLYKEGYFKQYLNSDGWQQEEYTENDFFTIPVERLKNKKSEPLKISIDMYDGILHAQIWKVNVGRSKIYLLDTNIDENPEHYREITYRLYGGDNTMRIKQEILLGVGGMKALYAVNEIPTITHMNEGHSAFLAIERIILYMQNNKLTYKEAKELVKSSNVFTTHTPVPAGNDRFSLELISQFFSNYLSKTGVSIDEFLKLGMEPNELGNPKSGNTFCMTVLALNLAYYANGVSKLHGHVSRNMWKWLWPNHELDEVPIGSITNGVHARSWIASGIANLFDRYLGPRWIDDPWDHSVWERVKTIPDTELWHSHERQRERLVAFVRERVKKQLARRGIRGKELDIADEILDPDVLTIGFARRFATYKRATLMFKDIERFIKLIKNKNMPIQFIFAGKAHPKDEYGKAFIKEIIKVANIGELRRNIVFIENYDMAVGRALVQGVDVWLNNPRRPLEASGTSGMKVCFNGGLNLSILDGWWDEAYNGENGWAIGAGEDYNQEADYEYQDKVESEAIYNLLEEQVVPTFYDRGLDNLPKNWIKMMKNSMMSNCPVYNTNRMVQDYTTKYYARAMNFQKILCENNFEKTKDLSSWKDKIENSWNKVKVVEVLNNEVTEFKRGDTINVKAKVDLGSISPDDVTVSIYYGRVDNHDNIINAEEAIMTVVGNEGNVFMFSGELVCIDAGEFAYAVRVIANKEELASRFHYGKIIWA